MKSTTIFLTALLLISCGEPVRFEEPQPAGKSNEKQFPKRLIGQYVSLDDSTRLLIANELIIQYSVARLSGMLDSIDMKTIKGDTAFSETEYNLRFDVIVKGDSTFQHVTYYDTLFDASKGDVLRKYKGHYFLNEKMALDSWRVTTLTRFENGLTIGTISTKDDIDNLRTVTATKSDTLFHFKPTKREMKKFLKQKGFSDKDTFIKVE